MTITIWKYIPSCIIRTFARICRWKRLKRSSDAYYIHLSGGRYHWIFKNLLSIVVKFLWFCASREKSLGAFLRSKMHPRDFWLSLLSLSQNAKQHAFSLLKANMIINEYVLRPVLLQGVHSEQTMYVLLLLSCYHNFILSIFFSFILRDRHAILLLRRNTSVILIKIVKS